jgi:DNA-directed RNA polymerase sigma subunit (sigma70/sigma32)
LQKYLKKVKKKGIKSAYMSKELQPMDISSPGQNLESYLNSIQNISILTPEEEKKLAEELYYNNDLEAARKLVMAHIALRSSRSSRLFWLWTISSRFDSRRECWSYEGC